MSYYPKLASKTPEVITQSRKLTLDEAFDIASRIGRAEIGSAWNGKHAVELKLNAEYAAEHYISLKCNKHATAAENLMDCVRVAEQIKAALS